MATVLPTGVITAVRWTRGLRETARTSTQHAHFVWKTVATIIEKASLTATQQIPFLELLAELQLEHGFKGSDQLKAALSSITGTGKGAKLAKSILECKSENDSESVAALQDLRARIERVERWENWARLNKQTALV